MNLIAKNSRPVHDTKCCSPAKCQLYQFIYNVYDSRRDVAYAPYEMDKMSEQSIDYSKQTVDDMLNLLYGRHVCMISDIRKEPVDYGEFMKMKDSYDIKDNSKIYEFCMHRWFRCLFALVPDARKAVVVSSWRSAKQCGVLKRYIGLNNVLGLPMPVDREVNVVINYSDDYHNFASDLLGEDEYTRQMVAYQDTVIKTRSDTCETLFDVVDSLESIAESIVAEQLPLDAVVYAVLTDSQAQQLSRRISRRVVHNNADKVRFIPEDIKGKNSILLSIHNEVYDIPAYRGRMIVVSGYAVTDTRFVRHSYKEPYFIFYTYLWEGAVSHVFDTKDAKGLLSVFGYGDAWAKVEQVVSLVSFNKFKDNESNYRLARKLNGIRGVMFFYESSVYVYHRNGDMVCVACDYKPKIEHSVCDVEILYDTIFIVDVYRLGRRDCVEMPLPERISAMQVIDLSVIAMSKYRMARQQYMPITSAMYLHSLIDDVESDGIIFCPTIQYGNRMRLKIFKWKPRGDTVDFKVVRENDGKWLSLVKEDNKKVLVTRTNIHDSFVGRIVECYYENKNWHFLKIRLDKQDPNSVWVYKEVLQYSQKEQMLRFWKSLTDWLE